MTKAQCSWLAGWLEGEGTFLFKSPCGKGDASPRIFIQAFSIDGDVIKSAALLVDAAIYTIKARVKSQPGWRFHIEGPRAIDLMRRLRPYMGQRRGVQIDKALAAWDTRSNKPAWKLCACGCGRKLFGSPRMLYARRVGGACAQAAYRKREAA